MHKEFLSLSCSSLGSFTDFRSPPGVLPAYIFWIVSLAASEPKVTGDYS